VAAEPSLEKSSSVTRCSPRISNRHSSGLAWLTYLIHCPLQRYGASSWKCEGMSLGTGIGISSSKFCGTCPIGRTCSGSDHCTRCRRRPESLFVRRMLRFYRVCVDLAQYACFGLCISGSEINKAWLGNRSSQRAVMRDYVQYNTHIHVGFSSLLASRLIHTFPLTADDGLE